MDEVRFQISKENLDITITRKEIREAIKAITQKYKSTQECINEAFNSRNHALAYIAIDGMKKFKEAWDVYSKVSPSEARKKKGKPKQGFSKNLMNEGLARDWGIFYENLRKIAKEEVEKLLKEEKENQSSTNS